MCVVDSRYTILMRTKQCFQLHWSYCSKQMYREHAQHTPTIQCSLFIFFLIAAVWYETIVQRRAHNRFPVGCVWIRSSRLCIVWLCFVCDGEHVIMFNAKRLTFSTQIRNNVTHANNSLPIKPIRHCSFRFVPMFRCFFICAFWI